MLFNAFGVKALQKRNIKTYASGYDSPTPSFASLPSSCLVTHVFEAPLRLLAKILPSRHPGITLFRLCLFFGQSLQLFVDTLF